MTVHTLSEQTAEPADQQAERAVLSAALNRPDLIPELAGILRDDDFHNLAHEAIWQTLTDQHATGAPCDLVTIQRLTHTNKSLLDAGGGVYLFGLYELQDAPSAAVFHAREVSRQGRARRSLALARRLAQNAMGDYDPGLEADWIEARLAERNPAEAAGLVIPTVRELLDQETDDGYAWLIPNLLERQDRAILTAGEGHGKSTLLRQIAIMCAAGLHPFTGETMPPISVLLIDLENSTRQTRRQLRPLTLAAGDTLDPDRLRVEIRVQGLDLSDAADISWLSQAVTRYRPDLLITGPVYKMANGDPNEEKAAKPIAMALDRIRAEHDLAIILEAHSAKAPAGQKRRPMEPFGWSGWMRWPEFGLHLGEDGTLSHWRGARDQRDWPSALHRGGAWPWTPANTPADQQWAKIRAARTEHGAPMGIHKLAAATGLGDGTIHKLIGRGGQFAYDWTIINGAETDGE